MKPDPNKPKRPEGRPTAYNDEVSKKICAAISAGVPVLVAASTVGVDRVTVYDWIKRYPEFQKAVDSSYGIAESRLVAVIASAASKQWQAGAWILQRHPKFRKRWAKPQDMTLINGVQMNAQTTTTKATIPRWMQEKLKEIGSTIPSPLSDGSTMISKANGKFSQGQSGRENPEPLPTKDSSFLT
jgi:hypothetical protein